MPGKMGSSSSSISPHDIDILLLFSFSTFHLPSSSALRAPADWWLLHIQKGDRGSWNMKFDM